MGALITQQLAVDFPHLVRVGISMGGGARSNGWIRFYQQAEIDYRIPGGALDGEMAVATTPHPSIRLAF